MLRRYPPSGPYLTKQAAAYPAKMNKLLAKLIVGRARQYKRLKMAQDAKVLAMRDLVSY